MPSRLSKTAERIVALLVPPACREEVVGDLHERFRSRWQYLADALSTVPLVILSRMRRTMDAQVLLMQAFALYLSFLAAASLLDPSLLIASRGLARLALPVLVIVLSLVLEDTYATPGRPSVARGPVLGFLMAVLSQQVMRWGNSVLPLPELVLLYGVSMSFLLSSGIRLLFPPVTHQALSVTAPALWLKQAGAARPRPTDLRRLISGLSALLLGLGGTWAAARLFLPRNGRFILIALVLMAYGLLRRF